jgi:thiol-disulfide isomerase/thioredoxin
MTVAIVVMAVSCGKPTRSDTDAVDPYLGKMDDHSWGGLVKPGGVVHRVNANGGQVSMAEFEGKLVWVDYAAPWCSPCAPQTQAIESLEDGFGGELVFLTVLTSNSTDYEDVANQQTAHDWAQRFGLNGDRVVAATNLWSRKIPAHTLFSPSGQMLYKSTGSLSAEEIRQVASKHLKQ